MIDYFFCGLVFLYAYVDSYFLTESLVSYHKSKSNKGKYDFDRLSIFVLQNMCCLYDHCGQHRSLM